MTVTGTHVLLYTARPEELRSVLRDVFGWHHVDAHDGWLIFKLPPAELGIHPASESQAMPHHELYLMCDDVHATVAELAEKGVRFTSDVEQQGFGWVVGLDVPGAGSVGLYQPRHATAYDLPG